MSRTVFADSSAFVALANLKDVFHARALRVTNELHKQEASVITTNLVFHEVLAVLARRVSRRAAIAVGSELLGDGNMEVVWSSRNLEIEAWKIYRRSKDVTVSLVDCVSFVIMRQLGLRQAFSFDKHFIEYGFALFE